MPPNTTLTEIRLLVRDLYWPLKGIALVVAALRAPEFAATLVEALLR